MSDVTRILNSIQEGDDPHASDELLSVFYDELRRLAAEKMAQEKPGQTLQATALVHEAYLRLVEGKQQWNSRGHFFAAAAEASIVPASRYADAGARRDPDRGRSFCRTSRWIPFPFNGKVNASCRNSRQSAPLAVGVSFHAHVTGQPHRLP